MYRTTTNTIHKTTVSKILSYWSCSQDEGRQNITKTTEYHNSRKKTIGKTEEKMGGHAVDDDAKEILKVRP